MVFSSARHECGGGLVVRAPVACRRHQTAAQLADHLLGDLGVLRVVQIHDQPAPGRRLCPARYGSRRNTDRPASPELSARSPVPRSARRALTRAALRAPDLPTYGRLPPRGRAGQLPPQVRFGLLVSSSGQWATRILGLRVRKINGLNVVPVELALTKPLQKRGKTGRYEAGPVKTVFSSTKQYKRIPEGVSHVKRPLAPRALRDAPHRQIAVSRGIHKPARALRPTERALGSRDGEVHVFEVRPRLGRVSLGSRAYSARTTPPQEK